MQIDTPQIRAIAERRRAIEGERSALRSKLADLDTEDGELEVAARVLQRLGVALEYEPELPLSASNAAPDNTHRLSIPEMVFAVVSDYLGAGAPGVTGSQIQKEIAQRWGMVDPNHLRPSLWRLWKAGRLAKINDVYSFPSETKASNEIEPPPAKTGNGSHHIG